MKQNINSLEDLRTLINKADQLIDDLIHANLIDIEFVRYANAVLKQITEIKFDSLNRSEMELASALFKTSIHTPPLNNNHFIQERLEMEVIQSAGALREILRRAALNTTISSSIPNELRLTLETKAYTLKCSLQDLWECFQNNEYQEEQRSSIQKESP